MAVGDCNPFAALSALALQATLKATRGEVTPQATAQAKKPQKTRASILLFT